MHDSIMITALAALSLTGCGHAAADAGGLAPAMPGRPGVIAAAVATAGTAEYVIAEDSAVFGERVARRVVHWARSLPPRAGAALAHMTSGLPHSAGRFADPLPTGDRF